MKKFYPSTLYAITILCATFFTLSANAQALPPATYTAVLGGNWHTSGTGPNIWATGEPPMNCVSCTIILNVPTNQTVTLNTHVVLSGNSTLIIGGNVNNNPNGTTLSIPNSGATDTSHSASINLMSDGTTNTIQVLNKYSSIIIASNPNGAGNFDGLFSSSVTSGVVQSTKAVGYAPAGFTNGVITYTGAPQATSITAGPATLSTTGTLPIILSSFNAVLDQGVVDLTWTTASESNSDHFSVQRSTNAGASWSEIGTVAAAGNSNVSLNYSFTDTKPAQGTSEYRLQLVDKDGKFTYSDVKAVTQGIVTGVSIYPNPARDYVNVTLSGTAGESMLIRLFNASGALLQERNVANAGGTTIPLAVSSYPEGNYLIVVSASDGSRQISKLLITK